MAPDNVFRLVNTLALISWLCLALLPSRRWVTSALTGFAVPLLFALLYVAIVASLFGRSGGNFNTLDGVAALFSNRWLLLAGWVHYLAFDLLIGTWEIKDARSRGIPHLLVLPCLALTFFFGPAGWLLYRLVRVLRKTN